MYRVCTRQLLLIKLSAGIETKILLAEKCGSTTFYEKVGKHDDSVV